MPRGFPAVFRQFWLHFMKNFSFPKAHLGRVCGNISILFGLTVRTVEVIVISVVKFYHVPCAVSEIWDRGQMTLDICQDELYIYITYYHMLPKFFEHFAIYVKSMYILDSSAGCLSVGGGGVPTESQPAEEAMYTQI